MAEGQAQAAAYLSLHQSSFQQAPQPTNLVASFRPHQSTIQLAP